MNTVRETAVRVMPQCTSSRKRLASPQPATWRVLFSRLVEWLVVSPVTHPQGVGRWVPRCFAAPHSLCRRCGYERNLAEQGQLV